MNIITKKLISIITILLAGVAFMASCSKQSEPQVKKKGGAAPVVAKADKVAKAKAMEAKMIPAGKSSLNAIRDGQNVTLSWQTDLAGAQIKSVQVLRSSTGMSNARKGVATLKPEATNHKDILPDENAYWYWVKLNTTDGKSQTLGPARVDIDKAGSSRYNKLEDKYKISVIRTDDLATLKWDFPEDEYEGIRIIRGPRPVTGAFTKVRTAAQTGQGKKGGSTGVTSVITSKERKSQYTDPLKNPNAEYWYWFRITLKSGAIVDRGPIKAEYARR